jgi:UPF0716 protein FxsA
MRVRPARIHPERTSVRLSLLPFFLLVVPLAEIATFVMVGSKIGVLTTIALVLATAVTGVTLLRIQGLGALGRIRTQMDRGEMPSRDLVHGLMIMVAGLLLLTPGFITDTLGLLLFVPAILDRAWRFLRRRPSVALPGDGAIAAPSISTRMISAVPTSRTVSGVLQLR